jgi:hypothetical protein
VAARKNGCQYLLNDIRLTDDNAPNLVYHETATLAEVSKNLADAIR